MTTPEYDKFIKTLDERDRLVVEDDLLIGSTFDEDEEAIKILEIIR